MGFINREASAVVNDLLGGLENYSSTLNFSIQQIEDELVEERRGCIFKYYKQNLLPIKELSISLRCVTTDCETIDRCCIGSDYDQKQLHFEIPPIVDIPEAIVYIGSTDLQTPFKVYTDPSLIKLHKYKTRGSDKPFVFIDTNLNSRGMMDCFIWNAPMLERLTVTGIFRDLRQVEEYMEENGCCPFDEIYQPTFIDTEAKTQLLNKKFKYYKQVPLQPLPNTQNPGQ